MEETNVNQTAMPTNVQLRPGLVTWATGTQCDEAFARGACPDHGGQGSLPWCGRRGWEDERSQLEERQGEERPGRGDAHAKELGRTEGSMPGTGDPERGSWGG